MQVFPRGSPLVPDLSKAIVNLTEGCEGFQIQKKWFGDASPSPNYGSADTDSTRLSLQSFKGLFVVNGFALCIMLVINLPNFIHANHTELRNLSIQRAQSRDTTSGDVPQQFSNNDSAPAELLQTETE